MEVALRVRLAGPSMKKWSKLIETRRDQFDEKKNWEVSWNFSCSFEDAVTESRTWRFLVPFQAFSTRVQKAQLIYL
jgi:hypothetical protein